VDSGRLRGRSLLCRAEFLGGHGTEKFPAPTMHGKVLEQDA